MTSPGLVRVHRWVALGLGAFIALVTAAGAALAFRDELTPLATPQVVVPARERAPDGYQRMLDAARSLEPAARAFDLTPAARADRATEVIVRGPERDRHLYFDPHDARLVADSERQPMPFVTMYRLHKELLAGTRGVYAVGVAGIALAFLAISGLVLWWPRAWKYALRLRLGGNRVAVSFDLHRLAGVTFAAFLLANALIGVAMTFDEATARTVNALVGWRDPLPAAGSVSPGPAKPLDALVAAAQAAIPEGRVSRIQVRDGSALTVRKVRPGENRTNGMNRILVDPASGTVMQVRALAELGPGRSMYEWLYPLHTGTLVGLPYRAVLLIAGLAPLLSLATGIILWRSKAKRSPSRAGSAAPRHAAAPPLPAEHQPRAR